MTAKETFDLAMNYLNGSNEYDKSHTKNYSDEDLVHMGFNAYLEEEFEKAFYWFYLAAERGNAYALYRLGTLYDSGLGCEKNGQVALEYYQKAFDKGSSNAAYTLGASLEARADDKVNYAKVLEYYIFAAERGHIMAMQRLEQMYFEGIGTERNIEEAEQWYIARKCEENSRSDYDQNTLF